MELDRCSCFAIEFSTTARGMDTIDDPFQLTTAKSLEKQVKFMYPKELLQKICQNAESAASDNTSFSGACGQYYGMLGASIENLTLCLVTLSVLARNKVDYSHVGEGPK